MSGTRSVGVRIEANAKQAGAEVSAFADSAQAALGRVGAAGEQLAGSATRQEQSVGKLNAALNRLAASVDPIESAYQKWQRAESLVNQARTKGLELNDAQLRGVATLQGQYQRLAVTYEATARVAETAQSAQATTATTAARALAGMVSANDNVARSANRVAGQIQNASYQVGDFAVQVASGQSAVTALAQQLPQLLGGFGMVGAIAGAGVALAAVALRFAGVTSEAERLKAVVEAQSDGFQRATRASERWREGLGQEARQVRELTEYYQGLSEERRQYEIRSLRRDEQQLNTAKGEFTRSAVGQLSSLPESLAGQVSEVEGLARLYPAGSPEREGMLSSAELDGLRTRARDAAAIVADFTAAVKADGADTVEALANVTTRLRQMAGTASDPVARMIRAAADEMEKMDPAARGLAEASQQLEARMQAMGLRVSSARVDMDALAGATERTARRLRELQDTSTQQLTAPQRALENLQAQRRALETGGIEAAEALRRTQTAADTLEDRVRNYMQTREQGLRSIAAAEAEQLTRDNKREEALNRLNAVEIEISADRNAREEEVRRTFRETDRVQEELRQAEERRRKADQESARAASAARRQLRRDEADELRSLARVYENPVRSSSGLMMTTVVDDDAERQIRRALKGTALDPDERRRANEKIERDLKQSQERQARQIERSTDGVVEYAADSFADLFEKNGRGWEGMLDTFEATAKKTFARIAAEAIIRPIVQPIVAGVIGEGGVLGSLAKGTVAGSAGSAGEQGSTGISSYVGKFGDAATSLYRNFTGTGGGAANTGWAWLDSGLNTTAYTVGPGTSSVHGFSMGPVGTETLAGTGGVTYGQLAGGALGVAGGLYGIYTGVQQGGAKGWATGASGAFGTLAGASSLAGGSAALGGASAGLLGSAGGAALGAIAAAAPYIAAVLAIASLFLPGQKPSDMTGVFRANLFTGESSEGGLSGDRYSQDNRDQAAQIGGYVAQLSESLRAALGVGTTPFNYEIAVGARDGLVASYGGRSRRYEADEAGSKQMIADITSAMIDSMKGLASAEVQSIIANSGGNNETLLGNLDWYNGTYKAIIARTDAPIDAFTQTIQNFTGTIDEARAKATLLGISEAELIRVREKGIQTLLDQRLQTIISMESGYASRAAAASGADQALDYRLAAFDRAAQAEREAQYTQLRTQLGLSDADALPRQLALNAALQAERDKLLRDDESKRLSAELTGLRTLQTQSNTLQSFLDSQMLSGAGTSPQQAFMAAQSQYQRALEAARNGGDLSAYTTSANALLNAGNAYLGSGAQGAGLRDQVLSTTRSLGASLDLPGFSENLTRGLERVMAPNTDALSALRDEVTALREELRTARLRAAA